MAKGMGRTELLLGRRTYEDFFSFWPSQEDNPFTEVLDNTQKYVASTTLREPLPWRNSTLLARDAVQAVARLKEQPGQDIVVLGSGELIQSLMRHNLVDEFVLLIHPLVFGTAAVSRRRPCDTAQAGQLRDDDHRRHHRDIPAGISGVEIANRCCDAEPAGCGQITPPAHGIDPERGAAEHGRDGSGEWPPAWLASCRPPRVARPRYDRGGRPQHRLSDRYPDRLAFLAEYSSDARARHRLAR
jgi:dihydrofolate reductase